jgi:hypothetical protein
MENQPKQNTDDTKNCSPEDGKVLIQANGHCLRIGERIAIISVSNYLNIPGGVQHLVRLDFNSCSIATPNASPAVTEIITRLFPEEFVKV